MFPPNARADAGLSKAVVPGAALATPSKARLPAPAQAAGKARKPPLCQSPPIMRVAA
jgi:hypothetical protein